MPRLSVLLPVRNGESTIERAVRSTLRSLGSDSELVVLDDGSTDATASVLGSIGDRRLRLLASAGSGGISVALDALLVSTDSEYVGRMDADDVTLPGRFAYQLRALERGADAVFTTVLDWHAERRTVRPAPPVGISSTAFPFHLLLTNPVSHPTLVARRSALEGIGGYRRVPAEDYDLWLRLAAANARLVRLAVPKLLYRIHPGQVTSSLEWRRASWADPDVSQAFGTLSQSVLGTPFRRLTTLGSTESDPVELDHALAEFSVAFQRAAVTLPALDRAVLLRKLHRRIATVRGMRDAASV